MGVSENGGSLFGGPFKGIGFYLGYKRGTAIWEMPVLLQSYILLFSTEGGNRVLVPNQGV